MEISQDFKEWLELLNCEKVDYVIVGAFAVAHHGHPRMTGDLDVYVDQNQLNAERLMKVLTRFGFGDIGVKVSDLMKPNQVIQLGYAPNRIDIVTDIDGVTFDQVKSSQSYGEIAGVPVPFISKQLLIMNKLATGRTKDKADAEALQDAQE